MEIEIIFRSKSKLELEIISGSRIRIRSEIKQYEVK